LVPKKIVPQGLLLFEVSKVNNVRHMQARPKRYAIQRPMEYRLRGLAGRALGKGRTLNISRRGLLFETEDDLSVGSKIECVVEMGPATNDGPSVHLHLQGVTVRAQRNMVAVAIKKYRLRTNDDAAARKSA
jgi:PilZ domain